MAQTVGMAGIDYGIGRVAALTKAINKEDLQSSNQDFFIRLFLNTCWWALRNYTQTRRVGIFLNDDEQFDNRIKEIFDSISGITTTMLDPWHDTSEDSVPVQDLYILIPSYNAFDGIRMSDNKQSSIMNSVGNYGTGLVIGEWFHLLQSIPSKRSFSFLGSETEGLIELSPFKITSDFIVFTDIDQMTYTSAVEDDSMSFGISPTFYLRNTVIDTPFSGHLTQISSVKDEATIYWTTDIGSSDPATTTTTTTTTQPPDIEEIRLKVFDLELTESCGPLRLYLEGKDKDYFLLEGNEVFLTKYISSPTELSVSVYAELYYGNEQYTYNRDGLLISSPPKVVKDLSISVIDCDSPISRPLDGSRQAYSFRYNSDLVLSTWGKYVKTGVIVPFNEWYFSGKGNIESPVFAWLGGKHSDVNTLWMQVNQGGTITATLTASNEYRYQNPSAILDASRLFLVTNSPTSNIVPHQHLSDIFDTFDEVEEIEITHNINIDGINAVRGVTTSVVTFNVETPNAQDPVTLEKIRGDIYLVLCYRKDLFRSENDDKIYLGAYFGQPTTTRPPEYYYTINIVNQLECAYVYDGTTSLRTTAFRFKGTQEDTPLIKTVRLEINNDENLLGDITISQEGSDITTDIRTSSNQSKYIDITLQTMPIGGGEDTITITGVCETTPPPPPPVPRYNVTVEIFDGLNNVYMYPDPADISSYKQTKSGPAGSILLFQFYWATEEGYEYRPDNPVATGSGPGSQNPDYEFLDRPTIVAIRYQSTTNPAMVSLPSPTPYSPFLEGSDLVDPEDFQNIYVYRGAWWTNNLANTFGTIYVPVLVPVGGGKVELDLGGDLPDPTTTPPPPTTPPPECDNAIYVICQQVLSCVSNGDSCSPESYPSSYQQLVMRTCCPLTQQEMLDIVRAANSASSNATLDSMYSSCDPANFSFIGDCLPKDQEGNCQETIHNKIIDVISCGSSENPLP